MKDKPHFIDFDMYREIDSSFYLIFILFDIDIFRPDLDLKKLYKSTLFPGNKPSLGLCTIHICIVHKLENTAIQNIYVLHEL